MLGKKIKSFFTKSNKIDHKEAEKRRLTPALFSRATSSKETRREEMKKRFVNGDQTTANSVFARGTTPVGPSFSGKLSNKNFVKTASSSIRSGVGAPKLPPGIGRGL